MFRLRIVLDRRTCAIEYSKGDNGDEKSLRKQIALLDSRADAIAEAHIKAISNGGSGAPYEKKARETAQAKAALLKQLDGIENARESQTKATDRADELATMIESSRERLEHLSTSAELNKTLSQFIVSIVPREKGELEIDFAQ